jgi:glutamate-1-semialdehyde 2,1-aminomutase
MVLGEALHRCLVCLGVHSTGSCQLALGDAGVGLGLLVVVLVAALAGRKLITALFTWRALAVAPLLSRYLAKWVKAHDYAYNEFFQVDGATGQWVELRQKALDRLADFFQTQYAQSIAWGKAIRESFSDLHFTDANLVPFPFIRLMREKFNLCSVVTASDGPKLRDLDRHWTLDVSGSYGLNVAGFERYKEWMHKGWERVQDLGPVLGPLHPLVAENIALLKSISNLSSHGGSAPGAF